MLRYYCRQDSDQRRIEIVIVIPNVETDYLLAAKMLAIFTSHLLSMDLLHDENDVGRQFGASAFHCCSLNASN